MTRGARLGIDFGTAHTVAVLRRAEREPRLLLFDGSPLLSSAVCAEPDGRLLTGRDAEHAGLATPGAFEPHPKRCIDDRTVLLGETEVPVPELIGAVLRRVADEAAQALGEPPDETVLTCPAAWATTRRATLLTAASAVLPNVALLPEPVAAARHFATGTTGLAPGESALVYDFGAGTFDATVVRRTVDGFDVLATEGLPDCGGLDVDAAIIAYLGTVATTRDPAAWARLTSPATPSDQRYRRQLWDNVRTAKEVLSRATSTYIHLPLLDRDEVLGREQFDALVAPIVERTLVASRAALRTADGTLTAIYLTGGSSRIPAVTTALHQRFDVVPTLGDQPELAVAEGAVTDAAPGTDGSADAAGPAVPTSTGEVRSRWSRTRFAALAAAATAAVTLVIAGAMWAGDDGRDANAAPTPTTSASVRAATGTEPTTSPTPALSPGVDACLVGTWVMREEQTTIEIDGDPVEFRRKGGQRATYGPDGMVRLVFTDVPRRATHHGSRWSRYDVGTVTARYRISSGTLIYTGVKGTGSYWFMQNGVRRNSGPMGLNPEPEHYTCNGASLTLAASTYTQEFTRER